MFSLTPKELESLRIAHRKEKNKKKSYKINALILLGRGWSYEHVSEALMIDISTLHRWTKIYRNGGLKELYEDNYKGSSPKLSAEDLKEFEKHLEENLYQDVKKILVYVKKRFSVKYSISGMTKLLHALEFVYKKPKVIPGKCDPEKQEEHIKEYEALKASKSRNRKILFMDGVHPQHNTMASYGWIRKGEDKEIKSNTGRKRVNINGAIDVENQEGFFEFCESVDAQSTIKLFKKIESQYKKTDHVYIYCDNARYYHSKLVRDYLKNSRIILKFLPPYSPNLNLIERFWRFFKKNTLYNVYYETFNLFEKACRSFFRNANSKIREASTLLTDNFQRFTSQNYMQNEVG